jgi:hypothetical protein
MASIPYLSSIIVDSLLISKITLVTNQKLVDSFSGISINFLQPLLNVAESFLVCDIVDNDDTVSTSVVGGSDGSETLLTSSIPLKNSIKCYQRGMVDSTGRLKHAQLTICNFTVFPSNSIVRIFWSEEKNETSFRISSHI